MGIVPGASALPMNRTSTGSSRLAGRPARSIRRRRASSARPRITAVNCSRTRGDNTCEVGPCASIDTVPSPSSPGMACSGTSIHKSARPSSTASCASSAAAKPKAIEAGQSSLPWPFSGRARPPTRFAKACAFQGRPDSTTVRLVGACLASMSESAVRTPKALESARIGYIAIGNSSVTNIVRRSRTNSNRSRRASAIRALPRNPTAAPPQFVPEPLSGFIVPSPGRGLRKKPPPNSREDPPPPPAFLPSPRSHHG